MNSSSHLRVRPQHRSDASPALVLPSPTRFTGANLRKGRGYLRRVPYAERQSDWSRLNATSGNFGKKSFEPRYIGRIGGKLSWISTATSSCPPGIFQGTLFAQASRLLIALLASFGHLSSAWLSTSRIRVKDAMLACLHCGFHNCRLNEECRLLRPRDVASRNLFNPRITSILGVWNPYHTLAFAFVSLRRSILLSTQRQDNHLLSQWGCGELWAPVSPSCCPSSPFLGWKLLCFATLSSLMACVAKDLEWNF